MRPSQTVNHKHANDPQPGDYWHEMLCASCLVVARDSAHVCICRKKRYFGNYYQFIDPEWLTVDEFRRWLSYRKIPGYWADCAPGDRIKDVTSYEPLIPELTP